LILLALVVLPASLAARGTYLEPAAFLDDVFAGHPPEPQRLWLTSDLRERIHGVLGSDLGVLRVRYWRDKERTAWILEAIGKERPITAGFVVADNRIERTDVLIFRESRGFEIRYPFFTEQFRGAGLSVVPEGLDKSIDGISGATLSVDAMTSMAQIALLLHRQAVTGGNAEQLTQAR
jgi:hypothetical protein